MKSGYGLLAVTFLTGWGMVQGQDESKQGKDLPRDPEAQFQRLDTDKDGKLSLSEFKKPWESMTPEKGGAAFREKMLEKLREKGIDPEKLKEKGIDSKQLLEKLKEKGIDTEKLRERLQEKGITPEKLKALREKKAGGPRIDPEKVFQKGDLDKNGYLDLEEWKALRDSLPKERKS